MKILLDECVTKKLKPYLAEFEIFTVAELGWKGVKNGQLMGLCKDHYFDILLTIDKNMVHQQNIDKYPITIVVFNSHTSKLEELVLFVPILKKQLDHFEKYKAYILDNK